MQLSETIKAAIDGTTGESDAVKSAAVAAAIAAIPGPTDSSDISWLWKALISGLLGILLISLIAIAWDVLKNNATPPDVLVTIFSSTLTALIGLFAKSPTQN